MKISNIELPVKSTIHQIFYENMLFNPKLDFINTKSCFYINENKKSSSDKC